MKICIVSHDESTDCFLKHIKNTHEYELVGLIHYNIKYDINYALERSISPCYVNISECIIFNKPSFVFVYIANETSYDIASEALSNGCSVYLSSSFNLTTDKIGKLYDLATSNGLVLFLHHPYMRHQKIKELINYYNTINCKSDNAITIDINHDLSTSPLGKYIAPNQISGEYFYPGGVFHNDVISALYLLIEAIGPILSVSVIEFTSGLLPQNISDCIEAKYKCKNGRGIIRLSYSSNPSHFRIDSNLKPIQLYINGGCSKRSNRVSKMSALLNIIYNFSRSKCHENSFLQYDESYYDDILLGNCTTSSNSNYLEQIYEAGNATWLKIKNKTLSFERIFPSYNPEQINSPLVLITGASGALGKVLVTSILGSGYRVRSLIRKLSCYKGSSSDETEIFYGDILDLESLEDAFVNVDYVIHAAANTVSTGLNDDVTVNGAKNIVYLCKKHKIKNLIYISTCNVYGVANYDEGYNITEESALEPYPERRGAYTHSKLLAERVIQEAIQNGSINAVCLRPGTFFGYGVDYFTPLIGFSWKNRLFISIGHKRLILPLICLDNIADAITKILKNEVCIGRTYNVIDKSSITKKQYIDIFIKKLFPNALCIHIPMSILKPLVGIQERILMFLGLEPFLTIYRLDSSQNIIAYDSSAIYRDLKWTPPYTIQENIKIIIEKSNNSKSKGNK